MPFRAEALQRSRGAFALSVARSHGRTRLRDLHQDGCLKLLFPRIAPGAALEAVMVNLSGGIVAGDALHGDILCADHAALTVTSQAAERCYRARPGEAPAEVTTTLRIGAGARLDWLPQETILFDGAALDRTLSVEIAPGGQFLGVESRVFGRHGSGESLQTMRLSDTFRVTRGGKLVLLDRTRWDGPLGTALSRAAMGAGGRLSALVLLVSADAASRLEAVRAVLDTHRRDGVSAACSSWNGMLAVRLLSGHDGGHRAMLRRILDCLRDGEALPRVWQAEGED